MKTVYIPLCECYGQIERALSPYVGIVGEIADHRPLLENILEEYFYGKYLFETDSLSLLTQYRLPTDIAKQVLDSITQDIIRSIQRCFQVIYPARHYTFCFLGDSVVIHETVQMRPIASGGTGAPDLEVDEGYIPERLRSR